MTDRQENMQDVKVLRETRGTCPICVEMVPARVIVADGCVFIEKDCPKHGKNRALLSKRPEYFAELVDAYFELMPKSLPQRDFILRLTARCNLECPICLASANDYDEKDLTLDQLRDFLKGRKRTKLDLMGAEPTLREDLEQIIAMAKQGGHITALHTNGLKFSEDGYLDRLVRAGLDEVHLQCDGFREADDVIIRGRPLLKEKTRALSELERLNVATDLVVTVLAGTNEDQMTTVLDYAAEHPFVKEVFFLGCRRLGRASDDFADQALAPDELIDPLQEQTNGRIRRDDIRIFQKIYFAMLAVFKVRKCLYIHHYLVLRENGGWIPVSDRIDLPYLDSRLDRFRSLFRKSKWAALPYLGAHGLVAILRKGGYSLLWQGLKLSLMLLLGFDLSRLKSRPLLLGFITACDPWIYDEAVAANCGKGEVANDQGVHDAGADANVGREKAHLEIDVQKARD